MDATPTQAAPSAEQQPSKPSAPSASVASGPPRGKTTAGRLILCAAILIAVGFGFYANSLHGTALLHHIQSTTEDPLPDNSLLHSRLLWPRIFSGDLMLTTLGEYRPLGYALSAIINRWVPPGAVLPWHVVLVGLDVLAALFVFLTLRLLVGDWTALALAAVYLVNPLLAPLVNDVNMIYLLWGLLFTIVSLRLYVAYLKEGSVLALVLSGFAFAAAAFSYRYAMLAPAFMIALWAFHDTRPRLAVTLITLVAVGAFAASLYHVAEWIPLVAALVVMLFAAAFTAKGRTGWPRLLGTLVPAVLAAAAYFIVAAVVKQPAIYELGQPRLVQPSELWFVSFTNMASSRLLLAALIVVALAPLVAFLWRGVRYLLLVGAVAFLGYVTFTWNPFYSTDVKYWEAFNSRCKDSPPVELNLATAYVDAGDWDKARDELLYLRYESTKAAAAETQQPGVERIDSYDQLAKDLLQSTVLCHLGTVYGALGNEKIAGFFAYPRTLAVNSRLRKQRLIEIGDYCLKTGYISWAENHYASSLIMNHYDVRLFNGLGKCLMYKNYFKDCTGYFQRVLDIDPDNVTALYHLAFVAKVSGDVPAYEKYAARWRAVVGAQGEIDFKPIYDAFKFDKDHLVAWFTGDPIELLKFMADREVYSIMYNGRKYEFSEAPVEIARYFLRRGNPKRAAEFLQQAVAANPKSTEALRAMIDVQKQLGKPDEAARYEILLEAAGR